MLELLELSGATLSDATPGLPTELDSLAAGVICIFSACSWDGAAVRRPFPYEEYDPCADSLAAGMASCDLCGDTMGDPRAEDACD